MLDASTPYTSQRWFATVVLLALYLLRVFLAEGWYVVTYALGIYLLNILLAFLTPKFDPAMNLEDEDDDGGESALPTRADDEFKPFIRRLPEFKAWHNATRAIAIALVCAFIPLFDIPVFWPILLMYFIILFSITMRRQIKHMIKYKYIPFDLGKKRYDGGGLAAAVQGGVAKVVSAAKGK